MPLAVILGAIAAIAGAGLVVTGIRRGPDSAPRNMVMLIGGMMMAAFGILIAGFTLVYQNTAPIGASAGAGR
ncbi:MAG: hypothetical protein V4513_03230 [Pseudomonadota bacterium]